MLQLLTNTVGLQETSTSFYDSISQETWFFLTIAALVLSLIASFMVKATFNKYNKVKTQGGRTAAEIARRILDDNGLHHIAIVKHPGSLTDHYDPRSETVALSEAVYDKDTIGAIGVAAHEVGHAIQHATGYAPIKIRHAIFPVVSFGTKYWYFILLAGLVLEMANLIWLAIALYAFGVVFQIVTLPLEMDASNRAIKTLSANNYLVGKELNGAKSTLRAAAFTYLAAMIYSLVRLLYLVSRTRK
ncbi:MAG: zinc metallopeptidase [Oscillospiraceae bacterium]|nr:zinc metallopeptidase [Oscillospiraceae bacterium]